MANNQGIRGIRQSIPSGFVIGRSAPGSSKGPPGLLPLPPTNQQALVQGAGGKATSGGGSTVFGTVSGTSVITTVLGGTGITITGAYPTYTVVLQTPVTVANGGTGLASGTSGGVLGFTASGTLASSALLGSGNVMVGGGAGATPATIANGQLPATATNDSASAGKVGEYVSSSVADTSAVSATNLTNMNITSISLTAGDWDVDGKIATIPAATTTYGQNQQFGWVNSTSATSPGAEVSGYIYMPFNAAAGTRISFNTGTRRFSLASTTTIYLSCQINFAVSTMGVYGEIRARRAR